VSLKINDNFRKLVKQNGGTDAFSSKYDYSSKVIKQYLEGTRNPSQMTIRAIAGELNVDWHLLVE
jgi:transcriptional regulator with XRE-family HTH domain